MASSIKPAISPVLSLSQKHSEHQDLGQPQAPSKTNPVSTVDTLAPELFFKKSTLHPEETSTFNPGGQGTGQGEVQEEGQEAGPGNIMGQTPQVTMVTSDSLHRHDDTAASNAADIAKPQPQQLPPSSLPPQSVSIHNLFPPRHKNLVAATREDESHGALLHPNMESNTDLSKPTGQSQSQSQSQSQNQNQNQGKSEIQHPGQLPVMPELPIPEPLPYGLKYGVSVPFFHCRTDNNPPVKSQAWSARYPCVLSSRPLQLKN